MGKVHRLCTKHSVVSAMEDYIMKNFKEYCDELLLDYKERKIVKHDITNRVCEEFSIVPKTFRSRFKSIYKTTLTDVCSNLDMPPKDIVVANLVQSENVREFWSKFHRPVKAGDRRSFFEHYFNCSTFERAKARLELQKPKVLFNPSIDENKSLVVSQVLGDGCYYKDRGVIEICHGEKQIPYALYKAECFNKAFPNTMHFSKLSVLKHTQGHKYGSWYSGRLPDKITKWLSSATDEDLVEALTPFGVLLLLLDDGYINLDLVSLKSNNSFLCIYIHRTGVAEELKKMFKTYGIEVAIRPVKNGQELSIKDMLNAVKLYRNFIEPFIPEIPECMRYKTELKI